MRPSQGLDTGSIPVSRSKNVQFMKIYLAGNIPKGDEEAKGFEDWRKRYQAVISKVFNAEFIIPRAGDVDETDAVLVIGKDSTSIKNSDLVIVYAEERLGAGTSIELTIAKYFKKTVVTIMPKNTYHRRSNVVFDGKNVEDWIHPFVNAFSDMVLEKIDDVASLKDKILSLKPKDISVIDEGLHRYAKQ